MANLASFLHRNFPYAFDALRVVRNGRFELAPPRITYALPALHREIKARFAGRPGVFFEVGANDGLTQSNSAYLEKYCGWKGILVEAVPHKYVECRANRPRAFVAHAALVPPDYPKDYVEIRYANLMSMSNMPGEIDAAEHMAEGARMLTVDRELSGDVFLAPARTASAIIDASPYREIDLFSLDVEGVELSVLQGIDFTRHRPKRFLIEVRDLDSIGGFLASVGYEREAQLSFHDHLFRDTRAAL